MKLLPAVALLVAALAVVPAVVPAAAQPTSPVVVSITIDDGTADQVAGADILARYGMRGTFYVISGAIDTPGYLTRAQMESLKAAGHEIGGHTVSHPDLTTIALDEARRQICTDRVTLSDWGFPPTSFAYPYTAFNADIQRVARECGYNSARTLGDIRSPQDCPDCVLTEQVPPADPFNVRTPDLINTRWTLDDLKSVVVDAPGGWIPFVLHQICDGCSELALSPAILDQFLAWLRDRGTPVRTVQEVMGGATKPVVPAPPAARDELVNPGLENGPDNADGLPQCWSTAGFGKNKVTRTRTDDAHSGRWAQRLDVISYHDGDTKILPSQDLGTCAPSATPGRAYRVSAWFKSTGFTQFALYRRLPTGGWVYWTAGPTIGPSDAWSRATWMTPALPRGSTGMSFGLALVSVGSLTTDDYGWTRASTAPRAKAS
ncbi:Polysaccharide deacetylase [Lentzea waywayandensis]|uniref:Polysaccharide deacetylase n=2 Tax=Lentzea waywayandensis TaxID=84724 RepID=A0A1I6FDY4_9PSEU|nr:Polysaccharide deacetylase [Lentzea waywayandensis]